MASPFSRLCLAQAGRDFEEGFGEKGLGCPFTVHPIFSSRILLRAGRRTGILDMEHGRVG